MITYKPLETTFNSKGFRLNQLYREGDFAIFHKVAEKGPLHTCSFDAGFEVVIISRHDGYEIGGVKIEPAEVYPGPQKWGSMGWTYNTLYEAELRLQKLQKGEIPTGKETLDDLQPETDQEEEEPETDSEETPSTGHRGRPKAARPALLIPAGKFSVKDLAKHNHVEYPIAFIFIKENSDKIKCVGEERRATKGPATKIFEKVN